MAITVITWGWRIDHLPRISATPATLNPCSKRCYYDNLLASYGADRQTPAHTKALWSGHIIKHRIIENAGIFIMTSHRK